MTFCTELIRIIKMRRKKRNKILSRSRRRQSNVLLIIGFVAILTLVFGVKIISQINKTQIGNVLGTLLTKDSEDSSGGGSSGSGSSDSSGSGSSSSSGESGSSGDSSSGSGSSSPESSGSNDSSSGSSGSGSSGGSTSDSSGRSSDSDTDRTRTIDPTTGIRTEIETKQSEQRTEVRLSEGERIRTRTKDGRTRIDITSGGIKTRLETRDDRVIIKAELEDGSEVELEDDTIFKIEERLAANQIRISTDEANRIVIQRSSTGAVSEFPVSVDLATNQLIVNTPSGQKNLAILPDQAVQNLIAANVINRLGGAAVVNSVTTGEAITLDQIITLGEKQGIPVYEINGISDQRLLGLIPVTIERTVEVSVETGQVVSSQTSLVNRLLDAVSF